MDTNSKDSQNDFLEFSGTESLLSESLLNILQAPETCLSGQWTANGCKESQITENTNDFAFDASFVPLQSGFYENVTSLDLFQKIPETEIEFEAKHFSLENITEVVAVAIERFDFPQVSHISDEIDFVKESNNQITIKSEEMKLLFKPNVEEKYLKPPFTYNALVFFALKASENNCLTVSEIYHTLRSCFPFFRTAKEHWKNSIRHSLSSSKWFMKTIYHQCAVKKYLWSINAQVLYEIEQVMQRHCVFDIKKLNHCISHP
ncbi:whn transcription factor-like protein, partial [Dinothrombium tinctorium]